MESRPPNIAICTSVDTMAAGRSADEIERATSRHGENLLCDLTARVMKEGLDVLGIETLEQMDVCIASGVDFLQGFLFAMPANPPEKVPAHLFRRMAA